MLHERSSGARRKQSDTGRLVLPFVVASFLVNHAVAQAVPATPRQQKVEIENTNSTFTPSDVAIPQSSPARPTFTAPAHIPPVGYLQFEQGFNQANGSPSGTNAQFGLNQTTKIALTTRLMGQFITQPYTANYIAKGRGETSSSDPGDLLLGGQAILRKSAGALPVVAVGYLHRVRAGSSADLDVGGYSQSALVLLSGDLPGKVHYDSNIVASEQMSGAVRRGQFAQSLALSRPLFEESTSGKLGGVIELSHATQPLVTTTVDGLPLRQANAVDLLVAGIYSVRPNFVLDAAFGHGLTSSSTQWQGSFGFTYLLPKRLWPDRHPVPVPVGPYHYRNTR